MMVSQVNHPQMALFQVRELYVYDIIHPDDLYLDCLSMFMGNNDVDIGPRYDSITTGWWFGTCFFHILGRVIPTDSYFCRGVQTTNHYSIWFGLLSLIANYIITSIMPGRGRYPLCFKNSKLLVGSIYSNFHGGHHSQTHVLGCWFPSC